MLEDQKGVQHACEAETSMMLAAFADCVRRERIGDAHGGLGIGEAAIRRPILTWKAFKDITPSGVIGDARKADAKKGERLLDIAAELLAEKLIAGEPWA